MQKVFKLSHRIQQKKVQNSCENFGIGIEICEKPKKKGRPLQDLKQVLKVIPFTETELKEAEITSSKRQH